MNKNDLKQDEKNNTKEKKNISLDKFLRIFEIILLTFTTICSVFAINTSKELAEYQIKQDRFPKVVCLDQETTISFTTDYNGDIYSYAPINNMTLNIHNIGVGIAQSCEIEWDTESVKEACLKAKKILSSTLLICEFEHDELSSMSFGLYDYGFQLENGVLDAIWYYDKNLEEICINNFEYRSIKNPYILPITIQSSKISIKVPDTIAILLLEIGNKQITEPLSMKLDITYEDIDGQKYNEKYTLTFTLTNHTKEDDLTHCTFAVSVE